MRGNIPPEMRIEWDEPIVHADTGAWTTNVRNLRRRTSRCLFRQDMCSFITADAESANVTFAKAYVAAWGAHQCWWFLREEICERVVMLPLEIEQHLENALNRPWVDDDDDGWDGGDTAWGRMDLVS